MNENLWKLYSAAPAIDSTFAALSITAASVQLTSCAVDRATLRWEPADGITTADILPYNSVVSIKRDTATFFTGRCRTNPRTASNPQEAIQYEILGPWFDLERITFEQRWKMWDGTSAATWQRKSRLILGQAEDGTAMTVGEIIAEVVAYAATKGALVALPASTAAWPDIKLPWEEISNLKCADVIVRCLAFAPDYKCRIDYDAATPVFHLVKRTAGTAVTLTLGTDHVTEIGSVQTRHDLAPPGVRIKFERTHSHDNQNWEDVEIQTAGNPESLDAIEATLPLAGHDLTTTTARIRSTELPKVDNAVNWLDKPWWLEQVPALDQFAAADLELVSATPEVIPVEGQTSPPIADLDRILDEGQVPAWLTGAKVARVRIELVCKYKEKRVADGKLVAQVNEHKISHQLTLTNVITNTYRRTEGYTAEPAPEGFAAALYAAWSPVQYDGAFLLELPECSHIIKPGDRLNIAAGFAAWANMDAHVQQVSHDIAAGTITIQIGPARQISPDNLLSLMRRLRGRVLPFNALSRTTGLVVDRANAIEVGGLGPEAHTTSTPGSYEYLHISEYDPDAPYNKEIDLDPAAITKDNEADPTPVIIKPVRLQVIERNTEGERVITTRHVLASAPETTPEDDDADFPDGEHAGDIIYWSGSAWVMLGVGSTDQILKVVNSLPSWKTPDTSNIPDGTVAGQILYWSGSAWITLDKGTSGQILKAGSTIPGWEDEAFTWPTSTLTDPTHVLARKGTAPNYTYGWVEVDTFTCPE